MSAEVLARLQFLQLDVSSVHSPGGTTTAVQILSTVVVFHIITLRYTLQLSLIQRLTPFSVVTRT